MGGQGDWYKNVRVTGTQRMRSREQGRGEAICPLGFPQGVNSETHERGNVMKPLEENLRQSKDCFTRIKIIAWGILLGLKRKYL